MLGNRKLDKFDEETTRQQLNFYKAGINVCNGTFSSISKFEFVLVYSVCGTRCRTPVGQLYIKRT